MSQRVAVYARLPEDKSGVLRVLQLSIEQRGGIVVGVYRDNALITGRGKFAGWRKLLSIIADVDEVALINAGDIPGRTIADLLKFLDLLRDHNVGLDLLDEGISTRRDTFAMANIVRAYRRAKLSQAIRNGQTKAVAAGKRIGRPPIQPTVVSRIRKALAEGGGVRSVARRFGVCPATVVNIRATMDASSCISC